jgi:pyrroline-5-carboxylate reductase
MPNTSVAVGQGMVLYTCNAAVTDAQESLFVSLLQKAGKVDKLDEKLIDAASAVSGCGPAYVYMFIEALADGAVACGLPRNKALLYAEQTLLGAATTALSSTKHPEQLKDEVCSPAGSTIEGVRALEQGGLRAACIDAVVAAYRRTKELGK